MDLMLENKVAVVTGASKGIGLAVTKAFVQEGAQVVAGALTTDSLAGIGGVTAVALDLTDPVAPGDLVVATPHGMPSFQPTTARAITEAISTAN